jgi:hypothetical protein
MDDRQQLILHLENIKKRGSENVTLNIDSLLAILSQISETSKPNAPNVQILNVDGGDFK